MLNCTPHAITIILPGEHKVILPPSGNIVRCQMREVATEGPVEVLPGIQVPVVSFGEEGIVTGEVEGLPGPDDQDQLPPIIVGMFGAGLIAARYGGAVFVVDTSPESVVRSAAGTIVGVRRLARALPSKPRP